ncbi:hypothetical protein MWT96_25515 (plasmid) [Prescottella equi]|uniref:Putative membrane protein n=2 Tax=Rhodococcus hoagii TaxID=43767 RepID=Q9EUD9_RHOHA|nr:hypothetical protein [Prescottella equi]AAG21745.1 unknown [Prescottella equi]ADI50213.1 putative membrane protein [Prescottella equi]ARX58942.1 putative membrane protein [Prescottella equi]ARX59046.1 putative membrane protein [Prescottella equi]ARX59095.1 putative membrane protein [Prescottella equi]
MSEQNTNTTAAPPADDSSTDDKGNSATKLMIGLSVLAVIIIAGIVFSIVILVRGEDAGPLVPADRNATGGNSQVAQSLFEPEPVFDRVNRVIYVPIDEKGAVLPQSQPGTDRPADQAPGGVMLERIHGNMDLPFSTSDGPTRFTDNGVAAGFSRTAQGAGLAAAHYMGYLFGGPDRQKMLVDAGFLSDPGGEVKKANLAAIPNNTPASAMPMVKVRFNPDLTLVEFGYSADTADGKSKNSVTKVPMVWREGTGWILKVDSNGMGSTTVPTFGEGWTSWW